MDSLEAKVRLLELAAAVEARAHNNDAAAIAKTAMTWYNDVSKWEKSDTPAVAGTLSLPRKQAPK